MKRFKKLAAITMAATMLVGSSLMVSAAGPEGGDTGSGSYEGYVDRTSVFSASIPTNAANVFNFFVDPNGLLKETGYARLEGKGEADFEDGSTLYFTRTDVGDGKTYAKTFGKDSDKVTAKNMSSYDVKIEVNASITGIDGITMADSDTIGSDVQVPTLYLAIVHDSDKEVVKAGVGGLLSGTITGNDDNFEVQYNDTKGKYEYVQVDSVDDSTWGTYDFYLTGACGGKWTDAQAEATPTVELTWKITDPNANEAPSIAKTEYEYIANQALAIPVDLGAGEKAATGISSVTFKKDATTTTTLPTNRWSYSNGKLIFTADYTGLLSGSRTHTITFDDAAKTTVDVTLTPWVANLAPSIETTTYKYTADKDVVVVVDLGRGDLAATGVASVTFDGGTSLPENRWSFSGNTLIFNTSYTSVLAGKTRTHSVKFNDTAGTIIDITLEPAN